MTGAIFPNPKASSENQERAKKTIEVYGLDEAPRRRMRKLEARKWSAGSNLDDFAYRDYVAYV